MKKKIFFLSCMLLGIIASAQVEIHDAKITGNISIGNQEVTVIQDLETYCLYKSELHVKALFVEDENVQLKFNDGREQGEIIKPDMTNIIFAHRRQCETKKSLENANIGKVHNELLDAVYSTQLGIYNSNMSIDEKIEKSLIAIEDYLDQNYNYQRIINDYARFQNPYHIAFKNYYNAGLSNGRQGQLDYVLQSIQSAGASQSLKLSVNDIIGNSNNGQYSQVQLEVAKLRSMKVDAESDLLFQKIVTEIYQHSFAYWQTNGHGTNGGGEPLEHPVGTAVSDISGGLIGGAAGGWIGALVLSEFMSAGYNMGWFGY